MNIKTYVVCTNCFSVCRFRKAPGLLREIPLRCWLQCLMLTKERRALEVIEGTIDENVVETENDTETETAEIEETEATEQSGENAEDLDHHITALHAGKARSIPIPLAATTEQENVRTDTEGMAEGKTENGTVIEVIDHHVGMIDGTLRRGRAETETYLTTAEVVEVAAEGVAAVAETAMNSRNKTERRALRHHPRKRNRLQT